MESTDTNYVYFKNITSFITDNNISSYDELVTAIEPYSISIKCNEELCILFYDDTDENHDLDYCTRSIILDKNTLKPVVSQYNKILHNEETLDHINNNNWNNIKFTKCYEGTIILLYNFNDKWHLSTRRCIDAYQSKWVRNKSYGTLFEECMEGKFTYDSLNKNHCYTFVLIHYKNRNIVTYNNDDYKDLMLINVTNVTDLTEVKDVDNSIFMNIQQPEQMSFNNIDEIKTYLHDLNESDVAKKTVTNEGLIVKIYNDDNMFYTCKLQTDIYRKLMDIKPNNSNIHQVYLELYKKDELKDYLPYFNKIDNNVIVNRINKSMHNISGEILKLYHVTRNKNSPELYADLPNSYKKILYNLHGIFIDNKKKNNDINISINVHCVYYYLKQMEFNDIKSIYYDRMKIITNDKFKEHMNDCIFTLTLCQLMFGISKITN